MDRIVTLIEDGRGIREALAFEHGLSMWIEREGRAVLFDTGASGAFLTNARLLGIDISRAEAVVVSHAHSDHSGGVRTLYESASMPPPLTTGPSFFDPRYAFENGGHHYIGPDFDAAWLSALGAEHRVVGGGGLSATAELIPGVHLLTGFKRSHPEEAASPRFVADRGRAGGAESFEIDDFREECCLAVETARGLVVALGCAHPGAMNMLDQVKVTFGGKIRAVLGGTHLMAADERRVGATLDYLRSLGCERIGIAHCSGAAASERIRADAGTYYEMKTGSCLFL